MSLLSDCNFNLRLFVLRCRLHGDKDQPFDIAVGRQFVFGDRPTEFAQERIERRLISFQIA